MGAGGRAAAMAGPTLPVPPGLGLRPAAHRVGGAARRVFLGPGARVVLCGREWQVMGQRWSSAPSGRSPPSAPSHLEHSFSTALMGRPGLSAGSCVLMGRPGLSVGAGCVSLALFIAWVSLAGCPNPRLER